MTRSPSTVVEFRPALGSTPNAAESWCARLHADDVTERERRAFEKWINDSPDHRAEYELSALAFALARGLADAPDLRASFSAVSVKERDGAQQRKTRTKRFLAAAAVLLVCVTASLAAYLTRSNYATDIGEQRLVALDDGTTVQLNTASAINIDLDNNKRQVTLSRGEAFFNVTRDPSRPFIVKAGVGEIQVLGTRFNVRLEGDNASVAVIEGHVKVQGVELFSGQGAKVASAQSVVKVPQVNAARLTSWREGKLYFDNDPLLKVLQEVNRYTETQFVVNGSDAANLRLSGVFRTGDIDAVTFALRETYGLKAERTGGRILVR